MFGNLPLFLAIVSLQDVPPMCFSYYINDIIRKRDCPPAKSSKMDIYGRCGKQKEKTAVFNEQTFVAVFSHCRGIIIIVPT